MGKTSQPKGVYGHHLGFTIWSLSISRKYMITTPNDFFQNAKLSDICQFIDFLKFLMQYKLMSFQKWDFLSKPLCNFIIFPYIDYNLFTLQTYLRRIRRMHINSLHLHLNFYDDLLELILLYGKTRIYETMDEDVLASGYTFLASSHLRLTAFT